MARCKVTNLVMAMSDRPPPYSRCDANGTLAAIPDRAEVRTAVSDANGIKMTSRHRGCPYCVDIIVLVVLFTIFTVKMFPYPLRASCTVHWSFDEPCKFVMQRLRCQILKWTSCSDCGPRGNRCLYSLEETKNWENNTIHATHLSPNLQLLDDMKIEFAERKNGSCSATGKSVSRAYFVVFDRGTNYCNLRNLVDGAELDMDKGFVEITSDSVCTLFSTAVCF